MSRVDLWKKYTEWPLTAAGLAFLAAYALPIMRPSIPPGVATACMVVVVATWALFGIDYVIRLVLSEHRRAFIRANLFDLAALIVPLLRPLQLIRLVTLLSVLSRRTARGVRGQVIVYSISSTVLLIFCGALAVTNAERGSPDGNILTVGDGIWWALATMTTVGYGDLYPTTAEGRLIASALMLGGITLVGIVTAYTASWLVDRVAEISDTERAATHAQVEALAAEVRALREQIANVERPSQVGAEEGSGSD